VKMVKCVCGEKLSKVREGKLVDVGYCKFCNKQLLIPKFMCDWVE